jgi:glyoxylase-like metal-dependent hydrolase (beta-lactamase superfamily II)
MQVTEHIHAIKVPFAVPTRFVYTYLIYGKQICLVDSGTASAKEMIFNYLQKTGRDPKEINLLVQTHSHADHIGLSAEIKKISGCKVAAHGAEKAWIEDIELQYRERPTATFRSYVQDSVGVDLVVRDGDTLDLGGGLALEVIHTPGHSSGSVSFLFSEDGALFSGDAIPPVGGLPIYADIFATIRSIRKLSGIRGLKALFSSWHDPIQGEKVYQVMDESLAYIQKVHDLVRQEKAKSPALNPKELTLRVLKSLAIPESLLSPIVITTIEAHLQESRRLNVLET